MVTLMVKLYLSFHCTYLTFYFNLYESISNLGDYFVNKLLNNTSNESYDNYEFIVAWPKT